MEGFGGEGVRDATAKSQEGSKGGKGSDSRYGKSSSQNHKAQQAKKRDSDQDATNHSVKVWNLNHEPVLGL